MAGEGEWEGKESGRERKKEKGKKQNKNGRCLTEHDKVHLDVYMGSTS